MKKHIMVQYTVEKEKVEEVKKAITDFVQTIRKKEPTTLFYNAYQESDDETVFTHFMSFADENAQGLHQGAEHTKKFTGIVYPICTQKPYFTDLSEVATTTS